MVLLYDIVGERFFAPLASRNRKVYLDTILFLHKLINELFEAEENDKTRVIDALTEHLNDMIDIRLYYDDNEELTEDLDNRSKAIFLVNKLEDCGWLLEEEIGNGKKTLDFNDYSYKMIDLIESLIVNNKPQYTSYVRTIKNTIFVFDSTKIDDLQIVDNTLNDFVVALRGLRSNIQQFYKNITKNKNKIILEELLDEFTGEYKDYFFDSAYLNLKIRDNVDAEIPKIEEELEKILNNFENGEKLVRAQMKEKGYENYDAALVYVEQTKKRIFTNIRTIPSIIQMIDIKNEKYVSRTVSVIIHLINRGEDIEGVINRLIDYFKNDKISQNFISLFEMEHYSFNALRKPRKYKEKIKPEMIPINVEVSEETKKKTLEILEEDRKYNIYAVNNFVKSFLGDADKRKISELEIKTKYEFIMLIAILMHAYQPNAYYDIELTSERIKQNGIEFTNFIIKQRRKK